MANRDDDQLDWATYKALIQVLLDQRQEYINEREKEPSGSRRAYDLLLQQIGLTDLRSRMLDRMMPITNGVEEKKES